MLTRLNLRVHLKLQQNVVFPPNVEEQRLRICGHVPPEISPLRSGSESEECNRAKADCVELTALETGDPRAIIQQLERNSQHTISSVHFKQKRVKFSHTSERNYWNRLMNDRLCTFSQQSNYNYNREYVQRKKQTNLIRFT